MPDASSLDGEEPTLDRLIGDLKALEMLADGWDEAARRGAHARAEAVDALNKEAFRRLIGALKDRPEFGSALKEAARDEVSAELEQVRGQAQAAEEARGEMGAEVALLRQAGDDAAGQVEKFNRRYGNRRSGAHGR